MAFGRARSYACILLHGFGHYIVGAWCVSHGRSQWLKGNATTYILVVL